MDNNIELPEEGWRIVRLGDFVISKKGKKPKTVSSERTKEFHIPYVNIKAFEKKVIDEYTNGDGCVFCNEDDFLMVWDGSRSGYVGRAIKGAIGSTLVKLSFPSEVFEKYAYYYLQSKYVEINTKAKGVGIPHVDPNLVWNYTFSLPPIKQQYQIVEKIEELFSELDKGIENLKTAQEQLKVYRQGVLKWAFEGRLTNENVKDGELPEGWEWIKLDQVCTKIQDGSHFSPQKQYDEPGENRYMYITAKNIRNNYMDFRKLYFVDEEYHNSIYPRCNPEFGDVLLTKDGINTGEVTQNTLKEPFSMLSSVCLFKTKANILAPETLKYFIQSPFGNQIILKSMTGTAIKRIVLRKIKEAEISLPPFKEQLRIIQEIESRLSVCDKIEETITTSLQQAEALRQSILKKAFEGKLVKIDKQLEVAKIVSIDSKGSWQRKVLAGHIIYAFQKGGYIGRTKLQKILYLCEQHAQLDYETHYIKEAAGPLDSKFLYAFLNEGKQKNWIDETPVGNGFKYEPSTSISELTIDYPKYFRSSSSKINFIIKLLKDTDTDTAELIATIYAIWNNYIIERKGLSTDLLPQEVYGWHEDKAKFKKPMILSTWQWMKDEQLIPTGFGEIITKGD